MNTPELSIVVPVYNEEGAIGAFLVKLRTVLASCETVYEVIFIDDGSGDNTFEELLALGRDEEMDISIIRFARNFGKDIALSAGIDHARGNALVPMDVDLQDPPELLLQMLARWRAGCDMVVAVRESRESDTWLKRKSAHWFYRIIGKVSDTPIISDAGDYRLVDRKIIDVIKRMPEKERFMKGIFAWPGFDTCTIAYARPERAQGDSKWNYWKLWNFALGGIFSFSSFPLRIWTYLGFMIAFCASIYMLYVVFKTLVMGVDVPGYASMTSILLFFSSLNMIGLGILGEYVARIFNEVKNRPLYVVRDMVGNITNGKD